MGANVVFSLKLDVKHRFIPRDCLKIFQGRTKLDLSEDNNFYNHKKGGGTNHSCRRRVSLLIAVDERFLLQVEVASAYQVAFVENFNLVFTLHKILTRLPCATHLGFSIGVVASSSSGVTEFAFVAFVLTYA